MADALFNDSQLISYHKFDENFIDSVGVLDGKSFLPGYVTGKIGDASQYLNNGDYHYANPFATPNDYSISLWFKTNKTTGAQPLFDRAELNDNYGITIETNKIRFTIRTGAGWQNIYSTTNVSVDTWYHVVAVHPNTGGSTIARLYVNGVEEANKSIGSLTKNDGRVATLGITPYTSTNYLDGVIDELIYFNISLSAQQIADLYALQNNNDDACAQYPDFDCNSSGTLFNETQIGSYVSFDNNVNNIAGNLFRINTRTIGFPDGKIIKSMALDDLARITIPSFATPNDYSISLWFRTNKTTGIQPLYDRAVVNDNYYVHINGNKIQFTIRTGAGWQNIISTTNVSVDTWYHVVAVHPNTGGSTIARLYVNGVEEANKSIGSLTKNDGRVATIGSNPYWTTNYLSGQVDEIAFWNISLSAGQVSNLYSLQSANNHVCAQYPRFNCSCIEDWVCTGYGACNISDLAPCNNVTDNNACGFAYSGDYSEFAGQACDYCQRDIVLLNTTACINGTLTACYEDLHFATCCDVTGLASDCYNDEVQVQAIVCVSENCTIAGFYDEGDLNSAILDTIVRGILSVKALIVILIIAMVIIYFQLFKLGRIIR